MEVLILILLAGAVAYSWTRIKQLEASVSALEDALAWRSQPGDITETEATPEVSPEQASAIPTVPASRAVPSYQTAPPRASSWQAEPELAVSAPSQAPAPAPAPAPEPEPEPIQFASEAESMMHIFDDFDIVGQSGSDFSLPKSALNFEDIFGRLLPIWAGGITLAVAGFFLVRYSIEAGLLSASVRVVLGFVFGIALVAAAEAANRLAARITDPRVAQALAGAGIATLYASFYLAGNSYGLIGSTLAFIGLAAVTAAAISLSYRFGLPSAVLGLVGGFAAPMLAGGDEGNIPMLATYLALVTAGLVFTGKRQQRAWLGIIALFFGLGWGALLLLSGGGDSSDLLAIGGYLLVVGAVIPAFLSAQGGQPAGEEHWQASGRTIVRIIAGALATFQMAVLVSQGDYTMLGWSLFGLLSAALAFLGWREPRIREGSAIAALTGLWLLARWPDPAAGNFAAITAVLAVIFAGVPLAHLWRGAARKVDIAQLCLIPLGLLAASYWQFGEPSVTGQEFWLALTALALAAFPVAATWKVWPAGSDKSDALSAETLVCLTSGAIALVCAGLLATPLWCAPLVGFGATLVLVILLRGRESRHGFARGHKLVWAAGLFTIAALIAGPAIDGEFAALAGLIDGEPDVVQAALRWLAATAAFALIAGRTDKRWNARTAEALAAFFAYGALAQFIPADGLAWTTAAGGLLAAWFLPRRSGVWIVAIVIAGLWAINPLAEWLLPNFIALGGEPVLLPDLPDWQMVVRQMLPFGAVLLAPMVAGRPGITETATGRRFGRAGLAALALAGIAVHVFYKHIFAISFQAEFLVDGLAERTVWQGALALAAFALFWFARGSSAARQAAMTLGAAALAHFGWFTLVLHNPLWDAQAVGAWPLANWLLPAYGLGIALLIAARTKPPERFVPLRPLVDAAIMGLIALLALSELRHAFAGSVLVTPPVGETEDLLRSLLGIVLAIAFLLWGARTGERSWRIGSLVLMLLAVGKVFLFDAAGLEGLARIASFMALGFSLIGIGWFYTRQLRGLGDAASQEAATAA